MSDALENQCLQYPLPTAPPDLLQTAFSRNFFGTSDATNHG
jgi:hypothetical protein